MADITPSGETLAPAFRFHPERLPGEESSLYYPISEYEIYRVQDCMRQMGLVIDLCCMASPGQHLSELGGLLSFLNAQQRALRSTLQAVEARAATHGPVCDPDPGG